MNREVILFIEDIFENINLIEDSTKKLTKRKFKSDKLIIDATIRRLEVIGESVKNIPNSFRKKYPKIPWRKISGFRDVLIHAYFGVNIDRVWEVIKKDIPKLKEEIKEILEKVK